jgi:hypothetical protein
MPPKRQTLSATTIMERVSGGLSQKGALALPLLGGGDGGGLQHGAGELQASIRSAL